MTYEPKNLKLWRHPENYGGATWYEFYPVIGQHRDSDCLDRSNFAVAKAELEAIAAKYPDWTAGQDEDGDDISMLVNPYEGHWAVGHCEWLGVHKDAPEELLRAADEIKERLANYPILDESHYSDLEYNEATEYWDSLPLWVRLRDFIKPAKLPCFAARHDLSTIMHDYNADRLWDALTA